MPFASRRPVPGAPFALLVASGLVVATPAAAFKVIDSPTTKGCALWANDDGQPLEMQGAGKIGRKVPCGEGRHGDENFETLFGEAPGTLVIRDARRRIECLVELAPGSTTTMVPKACQRWTGG